VQGAVFALLGLLIAFTFSGAGARFDLRRDLIVDHVNALGTAWLRLDLLPATDQPEIRSRFQGYVDGIVDAAAQVKSPDTLERTVARLQTLQGEIWGLTVAACQRDGRPQVATQMLPALNEVFDLTTTRLAARQIHGHVGIVALLVLLAILSALLAGHAQAKSARPDLLHMVTFAALISLTLYFILDFEYPRLGLINIDRSDQLLVALQASLK
jgi:hypothetical protein